MSKGVSTSVVRALGLAVFQRDGRGPLRLVGCVPQWLRAIWPQAAKPRGVLRRETSPFLENFLVDAAACWKAGGAQRVNSGLWVERDARGNEHALRAAAFTLAGRATLLVEAPNLAYEERASLMQKARELALAHETLQRAEEALAEEKCLLKRRVRERTLKLSHANAALRKEIATRKRFAKRLQAEHDLNRAILTLQSPEAIAKAALHRFHRLVPCNHVSVMELNPDHLRATVLASLENGKTVRGSGWPLSHAQLHNSKALKSGQLHRVWNQPNLFANPADGTAASGRVWPLIVDVPLVVDDTVIGILNLATDTPAIFTDDEAEFTLEVAAQIAVALQQARLFAEVSAGRIQLRALSSRLLEVQEAERRFLARELHDEIGQVLTGLKLTLQMSGPTADPSTPTLTEAIAMVDELMQRVRQLSLDLRPHLLDDLGLMPALDWLFKGCFHKARLRVRFQHTPLVKRLSTQLETAVFRIVQEALTNVIRHAGVSEVTVRLWADHRNQRLGLQVHDAGLGFDVQHVLSTHASAGLTGIRERVTLLGGQCTFDSLPGAGTRLTVEVPLEAGPLDSSAPTLNGI